MIVWRWGVSIDINRRTTIRMGRSQTCCSCRARRERRLTLLLLGGKSWLEISKEVVWRINHCRGQGQLRGEERENVVMIKRQRMTKLMCSIWELHKHVHMGCPSYIGEIDCFYSDDERLLIIQKNVLTGVVWTISTCAYAAHFWMKLFRPNRLGKLDTNVYRKAYMLTLYEYKYS